MTMNTEFIDRYGMLPPGTRVLVALSGGKDSVYLLHRLLELAQPRDLIIGAAHFNHMLRGAESQRDTEFVAELGSLFDEFSSDGIVTVPNKTRIYYNK